MTKCNRYTVALALLAASCSRQKHYTCAEIIGDVPGQIAVLPGHWSVTYGINIATGETKVDGVRDNRGRLVCDAKGNDVR